MLKNLETKTGIVYKRVILSTTIIAPFFNRYNPSPVNLLIACLLGFIVGILACVFHYELFYKGRRLPLQFGSITSLSFTLSLFVICVDAIGRALLIGMMKAHWVTHLILMTLVYLFLGAVIIAESSRNNFSIFRVFIKFMLLLLCIRAVLILFVSAILATPLSYTYIILIVSSIIGYVLLIPGALISYRKREYFIAQREEVNR